MKKLITIAILLLSVQLHGQMSFRKYIKTTPVGTTNHAIKYKHQNSNTVAWQVTGVAVFATITEAVGDGLYDEGKQEGNRDKIMIGKGLQAVSLASHFLYIPIMQNSNGHWLLVPLAEIGVRVMLFDPTYNITRGLRATRIGDTSYWDRLLKWTKQPEGMLFFGRMVFVTFTVSLTFENL